MQEIKNGIDRTHLKLEILIDLYFLFVIILNGESFTIVRLQE